MNALICGNARAAAALRVPVRSKTSLPSRVTVRWYQVAVLVLSVAVAGVTALAVYLAINNPTGTTIPASDSGTTSSETVVEPPCYRHQIPC